MGKLLSAYTQLSVSGVSFLAMMYLALALPMAEFGYVVTLVAISQIISTIIASYYAMPACLSIVGKSDKEDGDVYILLFTQWRALILFSVVISLTIYAFFSGYYIITSWNDDLLLFMSCLPVFSVLSAFRDVILRVINTSGDTKSSAISITISVFTSLCLTLIAHFLFGEYVAYLCGLSVLNLAYVLIVVFLKAGRYNKISWRKPQPLSDVFNGNIYEAFTALVYSVRINMPQIITTMFAGPDSGAVVGYCRMFFVPAIVISGPLLQSEFKKIKIAAASSLNLSSLEIQIALKTSLISTSLALLCTMCAICAFWLRLEKTTFEVYAVLLLLFVNTPAIFYRGVLTMSYQVRRRFQNLLSINLISLCAATTVSYFLIVYVGPWGAVAGQVASEVLQIQLMHLMMRRR